MMVWFIKPLQPEVLDIVRPKLDTSAELDVLSYVSEGIDILAEEKELKRRRDEHNYARLAHIINLGSLAVNQGNVSRDTLIPHLTKTVSRHRELAQHIGYDTVNRPDLDKSSRSSIDIFSMPVRIRGAGLTARLRFSGTVGAETFWQQFDEAGIEAALDEHIAPKHCWVTIKDPQREGMSVTNTLMPVTASLANFIEEKDRVGNVSEMTYDPVLERASEVSDVSEIAQKMNDLQLKEAAGLIAVHNAWLDEVELNI